jgi:hypothetical protein
MRQTHALEIVFLVLVLAVSLVGFSSLYTGEQAGPDAYQSLHIVTSLAWLLTSAFFLLDGYVQFLVAQADRTTALTVLVASIGRAPAFVLGLTIFAVLLGLAWRVSPARRTHRGVSAEAVGP